MGDFPGDARLARKEVSPGPQVNRMQRQVVTVHALKWDEEDVQQPEDFNFLRREEAEVGRRNFKNFKRKEFHGGVLRR